MEQTVNDILTNGDDLVTDDFTFKGMLFGFVVDFVFGSVIQHVLVTVILYVVLYGSISVIGFAGHVPSVS